MFSPLLDSFRRKEVTPDVRLLAAQGAIALRPLEQLGILALLTEDADDEIRATAEATLQRIPLEVISAYIASKDVPEGLREFFVSRGVPVASAPGAERDRVLIEADDEDLDPALSTTRDQMSIVQLLAGMTVPQKIKVAMKGSREVRTVLVRDSNRMVSLAVLSSPKLSETEVESIARMGNVSEDVLRTIAHSRAWIKNYNIIAALVRNPKTPLALTLRFLNRLTEKDIRSVSTDHNVPEPLRVAARKKVVLGG